MISLILWKNVTAKKLSREKLMVVERNRLTGSYRTRSVDV